MVQQAVQTNVTTNRTIRSALSAVISRVVSIAIFAATAAYLMYRDNAASFAMGRAAYLADQAAIYDSLYADEAGLLATHIVSVILGVMFIGFVLAMYELLAFAIRKLLAEPILKALFPVE